MLKVKEFLVIFILQGLFIWLLRKLRVINPLLFENIADILNGVCFVKLHEIKCLFLQPLIVLIELRVLGYAHQSAHFQFRIHEVLEASSRRLKTFNQIGKVLERAILHLLTTNIVEKSRLVNIDERCTKLTFGSRFHQNALVEKNCILNGLLLWLLKVECMVFRGRRLQFWLINFLIRHHGLSQIGRVLYYNLFF